MFAAAEYNIIHKFRHMQKKKENICNGWDCWKYNQSLTSEIYEKDYELKWDFLYKIQK